MAEKKRRRKNSRYLLFAHAAGGCWIVEDTVHICFYRVAPGSGPPEAVRCPNSNEIRQIRSKRLASIILSAIGFTKRSSGIDIADVLNDAGVIDSALCDNKLYEPKPIPKAGEPLFENKLDATMPRFAHDYRGMVSRIVAKIQEATKAKRESFKEECQASAEHYLTDDEMLAAITSIDAQPAESDAEPVEQGIITEGE